MLQLSFPHVLASTKNFSFSIFIKEWISRRKKRRKKFIRNFFFVLKYSLIFFLFLNHLRNLNNNSPKRINFRLLLLFFCMKNIYKMCAYAEWRDAREKKNNVNSPRVSLAVIITYVKHKRQLLWHFKTIREKIVIISAE